MQVTSGTPMLAANSYTAAGLPPSQDPPARQFIMAYYMDMIRAKCMSITFGEKGYFSINKVKLLLYYIEIRSQRRLGGRVKAEQGGKGVRKRE